MPPRHVGLFGGQISGDEPDSRFLPEKLLESPENFAAKLLARASGGDVATLRDAHERGTRKLYEKVLDTLVERNQNSVENLRALAAHISASKDLRASPKLAEALLTAWNLAPERAELARTLHVAALSDDAAMFQAAVESAHHVWREGRLPGLSAADLRTLFESEYWVLAPEVLRSGAGFVLKEMLADIRRQLTESKRRASI